MKTIIETTRNFKDNDEKGTDGINHDINYTEHDYQRIRRNDEPVDTPNKKAEADTHPCDSNYNEDLQDLDEILKAPLDVEETVQIDLWDFAGDREYYNTHKAFLSKDAIYLVTFDVSENANETSLEDERCKLRNLIL